MYEERKRDTDFNGGGGRSFGNYIWLLPEGWRNEIVKGERDGWGDTGHKRGAGRTDNMPVGILACKMFKVPYSRYEILPPLI